MAKTMRGRFLASPLGLRPQARVGAQPPLFAAALSA